MTSPRCSLVLLLGFCVLAAAEEPVSFNREIRPIFSDTCFQCHGPDEAKRKGGLRLDERAAALRPAESGEVAIVPGQPEESELLRRLVAEDREEVMPPPRLHKTIAPPQVATVRRWIAQGAKYEGHWAFLPPQPGPVPEVAGARHEIDRFIQARLSQEGLAPAPEAPKETLIRRVSLDLTGLPPTPEEVDAFVADGSPKAYEKVVDRLLASPRYGEQMAVQWLDFARYADSNGFQTDTSRQMWPWRDWVIQAFNANQRFDQFTIEQLAGDLLPGATQAQKVATGFLRNGRLNGEGGRIVEEWFAETVIDRVETVGLTWLGLTFNCCRCHDHKYDPISQREFYQLFAFFNSVDETGVLGNFGGGGARRQGGNTPPVLVLLTPEGEAEKARLESALKNAQTKAGAARRELPKLQGAWEQEFRARLEQNPPAWVPLAPAQVSSTAGATLTRQPDGSWLASGKTPKNELYVIEAPLPAGSFGGLRLEVLPDPSLPGGSLGRASNGNFVLSSFEAEIYDPAKQEIEMVQFARAAADYEQRGYEVSSLLDTAKKKRAGWAIDGNDPAKRLPRKAMFLPATPVTVPAGAILNVRLRHQSGFAGHSIGRFRLDYSTSAPSTLTLEGSALPETVRTALALEPKQRTREQAAELARFFQQNTDNPATRAAASVAEAKKRLEDHLGAQPNTMVMQELPQPREAFILKRGEYDKPGDPVGRAVPAALPPLPAGAPVDRLGFARWLVAQDNPLTARVWVNRAWEKFFGLGLVRTTENLGSQAEWPSHPELLDWLATEFVRLGWDMKALQKEIVLSATYRQSSRVSPELLARDPENRLLARGPRFRLSAELVRDQALALGGLLAEKLGGPSVRPYMPEGIWDETSRYGDLRGYKPGAGADLYRRSFYTIWKRTASPPTMTMFDSPTREVCTVKRTRTNTPLQALALLNEVTFVEAARALAQRMIMQGGATPAERLTWAFRRATARPPTARELAVLQAGLEKRLALYGKEAESAASLVKVGALQAEASIRLEELAAYTVTANVILNLDEVVTRE